MKTSDAGGGVGVGGLLLVPFVALKLTHQIDWSWWWVMAPVWGPLVLCAAIMAVWFLCVLVKWAFQ